MTELLRRAIHPLTRILDAKTGLVEYVASDETLDAYREVIRASGWRFDNFAKNAPFVDSHDYGSIDKLVGKVVDFAVKGKQLVETVQWAKDVAENKLAQLGWKMTEGGFLKAVSVGFWPTKMVSKWDQDQAGFLEQLSDLGLDAASGVRAIFIEQQQVELSSVIIGANPNALAKAYKAGAIADADLETFSAEYAKRELAMSAESEPAAAVIAQQRAREEFLGKFNQRIKTL